MQKIKKAKIKDRSLIVEGEERMVTEGGSEVTNEVAKKCAALAHDDLVKAFDNLKKHLIKICDLRGAEYIDKENIDDCQIPELENYTVTGFSIGGNDESEGVTLIGNRTFNSGKVLNIVAPFTQYAGDDYAFAIELASDIHAAVYEVECYLNGKCASKQLEIPFDEAETTDYRVSFDTGDGVYHDITDGLGKMNAKMDRRN